jgi:hypothetical protein
MKPCSRCAALNSASVNAAAAFLAHQPQEVERPLVSGALRHQHVEERAQRGLAQAAGADLIEQLRLSTGDEVEVVRVITRAVAGRLVSGAQTDQGL